MSAETLDVDLEYMQVLQGREGIRGKHWFLETDLKTGTVLKVDKTGKAILTVLRHLGRLSEVQLLLPNACSSCT